MLNKNTVQPITTFAVCIFCLGVISSLDYINQNTIIACIPIILGLVLIEAIVIKNKESAKNKLNSSLHVPKYDSISIWSRLLVVQKLSLKPNINSLLESLTADLEDNSFETKNIPTLAKIKINQATDFGYSQEIESKILVDSINQIQNLELKVANSNQQQEQKELYQKYTNTKNNLTNYDVLENKESLKESAKEKQVATQNETLFSLIKNNFGKKFGNQNSSNQKIIKEISNVPRTHFKWSVFKPNLISLVVIVATILGFSYNLKVNAAANPVVSLSVPAVSRIGESWTFTAGFSNTGSTVGYGPFIDVMLPTAGIDGVISTPLDGVDFVSATYLGSPTINTVLTFPSSYTGLNPCSTGQFPVIHPLAKDTTGTPLKVCGLPNDKLIVSQLPFGSYTPGQPIGNILYTVNTSNLADVGTAMTIKARAGFYLGNDSFSNPVTDPSIVSAVSSANNTPTLFDVTKTYTGPENETATGPNFPRSYTISADIATGQTISNFKLIDTLPNNIVITGITSSSAPITSNITTFPYGPVNGGHLDAIFNSPITGGVSTNDANFTVSFYVPQLDANNQPVLNPATGSFVTSINSGSGNGNWTPIDSRDGASVLVTSQPSITNSHTLTDKSIATQKSVANITDSRTSPGDTLEYTLNFQISDYFSFDNLTQLDTFSDGQRFDSTFAPTLTVSDRNGNTTGNFTLNSNYTIDTSNIGNTPINVDPTTNGSTTVNFDISQAMIGLGADGILQGGRSVLPNAGGATGTIKFRTKVQQYYSDNYTLTVDNGAVSLNDSLTNITTITGRVLNNTSLAPTGSTVSDNSSASISILSGNLTKTIYAINGSTTFTSPVTISANDIVTYRIQYSVPQSDVIRFKLVDYLPLPVFPVAPINLTIDQTV